MGSVCQTKRTQERTESIFSIKPTYTCHQLKLQIQIEQIDKPNQIDEDVDIESPSYKMFRKCSIDSLELGQYNSQQLVPFTQQHQQKFYSDRYILNIKSLNLINFTSDSLIKIRNQSYETTYRIEKVLGYGGFATVFKVKNKFTCINIQIDSVLFYIEQELAMKQISKGNHIAQEKLLYEMEILMELDHPNILKVIEMFRDQKHYYIISEYLNGGSLAEDIKQDLMNETKIAQITIQLLMAISYLHKLNIIHRDIKPENILYTNLCSLNQIKLIDFGIAHKLTKHQFLQKNIGTLNYMAPEMFQQHYSKGVDMWALGVTLFQLLTGQLPFKGFSEKEIIQKIQNAKIIENQKWLNLTQECRSFIQNLLIFNPTLRYNVDQALKDPWIQKYLQNQTTNNQIIEKFKKFTQLEISAQVLLTVAFHYLQNLDLPQQILDQFFYIDYKHDGIIDKEELLLYIETIIKDKLESVELVSNIFQSFNNPEVLKYSHYLISTVILDKLKHKKIMKMLFDIMDHDKDSYITQLDFEQILGNQEQLWSQFVLLYDKNDDGKISISEFEQILKEDKQQQQDNN